MNPTYPYQNGAALNVSGLPCRWCGMSHGVRCPTIKAYEYHPNGAIKRVEFFAPNDYMAPSWVVREPIAELRIGATNEASADVRPV